MKTISNDQIKLEKLEKKFGGPVAAARAVGVSYTAWFRWRTNRRALARQTEILIDLLLDDSRTANGN